MSSFSNGGGRYWKKLYKVLGIGKDKTIASIAVFSFLFVLKQENMNEK